MPTKSPKPAAALTVPGRAMVVKVERSVQREADGAVQ
jgi:hypothetical protein